MTKTISAIVIILLAAGGIYWYLSNSETMEISAQNEKKVGFTWNITELGENPAAPGVPRTGITLTSGGKTYPIGEFDGSCSEIDGTSWTLVEGEKTGVICWWAGGGSEAGVFEEEGRLVIKVGILEEGSAEEAGFRGNFQTIATVE